MSSSFQPDSTPQIGDQSREGMNPTADDRQNRTGELSRTGDATPGDDLRHGEERHQRGGSHGEDRMGGREDVERRDDVREDSATVARGDDTVPDDRSDAEDDGFEHDRIDITDAGGPRGGTSSSDRAADDRDRHEGDRDGDADRARDDAGASGSDDSHDQGDEGDENRYLEPDENAERRAEEFAAEHDPADHDVRAGEEFRQRGDLIADEDGHAKAVDAEGHYVDAGDAEQLAGGTAVPGGGARRQDDPDDGGDPDGSGHDGSGHDGSGNRQGQGGGDAGRGAAGDQGGGEAGQSSGSSEEQVEDGGYGVGSARPFASGRTPVGHPIKAWNDTRTYAEPGHPHYEGGPAHVWFTDAQTAERAGFSRAGE
ncbi:sunset domain-containing protein [Mobilicoccus massiliensis]|uniref:sunset domain-containing protein n=1 Tax=Mobilicoccus massiliensis TaxID=1522310 RepID=UPI00058C5BEA|nr:hypothetical protein [Mobilicoccus massiliensis]